MDMEKQAGAVKLTPEIEENFLAHLLDKGRSQTSLREYRRSLAQLRNNLPEDKTVTSATGLRWKRQLEEQGLSPRTVNARLSVWNSLMNYLGHRDWQVDDFARIEGDLQPELTRAEYLRMLSAAKQFHSERGYLLIMTLGGAGLRIQELPQLTAETVRRGTVCLKSQNGMTSRMLRLPEVLQRELAAFAEKEGITEGPLFVTSGGKPLDRANIWQCIKRVSRDARVPEEKANPRCLWKMYRSTQESIRTNISVLAEQAYERLLEQEIMTMDRRPPFPESQIT